MLSAGHEIYINENTVIGHLGVQRDWKIFKKAAHEEDTEEFDQD